MVGCKLVCALHEHVVHTCRSLDKKFKYTNLIEAYTTGGKFPEGESPLRAGVTSRTVSKSQGGLP